MDLTVQIITISEPLDFDLGRNVASICCYNGTTAALKVAEEQKPSVILLDYKLEELNTGLYIKSLLSESSTSKVIILGNDLSDEIVLNCLINGAWGYLEYKDMNKFLLKAVQSVGHGQAWVTRRLVGLLIERIRG